MPAKQRSLKTGSKIAFIAEHDQLSASEVVKLAKKSGFNVSEAYVHTARTTLRKRGATAAPASAPRAPRGAFTSNGAADKTAQLARLIVQVGIDTAREILARVESRSI